VSLISQLQKCLLFLKLGLWRFCCRQLTLSAPLKCISGTLLRTSFGLINPIYAVAVDFVLCSASNGLQTVSLLRHTL
jgi:hypothetical protein